MLSLASVIGQYCLFSWVIFSNIQAISVIYTRYSPHIGKYALRAEAILPLPEGDIFQYEGYIWFIIWRKNKCRKKNEILINMKKNNEREKQFTPDCFLRPRAHAAAFCRNSNCIEKLIISQSFSKCSAFIYQNFFIQ